jgi:hypothetical protein
LASEKERYQQVKQLSQQMERAILDKAEGNGDIAMLLAEYMYNLMTVIDPDSMGETASTQTDQFVTKLELHVADGYRLEEGKWVMPNGSVKLSFDYDEVFSSKESRESFTADFVELLKKYKMPNGYFQMWNDGCPLCYTPLNKDGSCPNERCPKHRGE